jgi:glycosyltransferase involved in cell wall biosynthesis
MDVFALTSDTEQMPVALVEAMASALPAIATDVGDVRAMLGAGAERCVAPLGAGCEAALAASLDALAADAALRRELGAANRARAVRDFGFQAMVGRYAELYRAALGAAGGR